jgi:hypothetical protein
MTPVDHRFKYRLYMAYLDLDELPQLTGPRGLISKRRLATASFRRADHLHGTSGDLQTDLRQLIVERTGVTVQGPIRLLTQLRYFGYFFSPLNLYYCFDSAGEAVQAIVAEVNNTPWREQHCYVLWEGNQTPGKAHLRYVHRKEFHVSPFMEMDYDYRWRLSVPGDSAFVQLQNVRGGETCFEAGMTLERRPLTRGQLTRLSFRFPMMTAQIVAAIHWQALKLWWKKCPFYSHPKKQQALLSR